MHSIARLYMEWLSLSAFLLVPKDVLFSLAAAEIFSLSQFRRTKCSKPPGIPLRTPPCFPISCFKRPRIDIHQTLSFKLLDIWPSREKNLLLHQSQSKPRGAWDTDTVAAVALSPSTGTMEWEVHMEHVWLRPKHPFPRPVPMTLCYNAVKGSEVQP